MPQTTKEGALVFDRSEFMTYRYERLTQQALEDVDYKLCYCCWLITTGRSGTVWLTQLFNEVEAFMALHESHPSLFYEGRLAAEGKRLEPEAEKRLLRACRGFQVREAYHRRLYYVDTSPFAAFLAEGLRAAFARSRFLNLSRDPRAFVRSALARDWGLRSGRRSHWWPANCPHEQPHELLIWWWAEVHRKGLELEAEWGPEIVRRVRVEDLWSDPGAVLGLLEWTGVLPDADGPQRWLGAILEKQRTKVNANTHHAEWEPEWDAFLREVAGETMEAMGYEL